MALSDDVVRRRERGSNFFKPIIIIIKHTESQDSIIDVADYSEDLIEAIFRKMMMEKLQMAIQFAS